MFILSYPTTESPFRLKNVPSDVTFLLQIDQILRAFHENASRWINIFNLMYERYNFVEFEIKKKPKHYCVES